ncbi:Spliceosome subunit [Phaffia rhodozyma]|uniref:Spliceosome subunit n=1 Tax=Phaffia rhodozyma TaxID=264483 RepID=A0A0F7SLA4_PHARH|nr:Spliceosome subunit [Phaffia rhodozyma]
MGRLAEAQRKLLEQMMGAEAMGIIQVPLHFTDDKVCKNYLCGTCPHIVFTNTKMDLGPCPRAHQEKLQIEYQLAKLDRPDDAAIARIENEWQSNIFMFVDDCDRRIHTSQKRLEKTPEENAKTTALMREIGEIEISIQDGTAEIEQLGEAGKVDESIQKLAAVDALKAEKADKERELQQLAETSGASGHQKLRVCEVCGAYLSILDSDRRLADHFGGKMHLGYKELRELLVKINEERQRKRSNPTAHAPATAPASMSHPAPAGPPSSAGGGYDRPPGGYQSRESRDRYASSRAPEAGSGGYDDRDRKRGYDDRRGGYDDDRAPKRSYDGRDRERSRSPSRRKY